MAPSRGSVCCVGLGFVGLYTALGFVDAGYEVVGIDIDAEVVEAVEAGKSPIGVAGFDERVEAAVERGMTASTNIDAAADCDAYLLSVPTPLTDGSVDVSAVRGAAGSVAEVLDKDDLVVVQSSVYPGCTREVILPELERSGLTAGADFGISQVPERYSPGDELAGEITRVVGSITEEWREVTAELYRDVVDDLHAAPTLEAAEAAKLTENTQRAVNIALVNELSKAFDAMGVETEAVLEAAGTKWNFHDYFPGLGVGGHCLPVDPWYLTETARKHGATPSLVEEACHTNDYMPHYHFSRLTRNLNASGTSLREATVALLGISYKPGVRDLRNSAALDFAELLVNADAEVQVYEPMFSADEVFDLNGQWTVQNHESAEAALEGADAVVVGTPADEFEGVLKGADSDLIVLNPWRLLDVNGEDS